MDEKECAFVQRRKTPRNNEKKAQKTSTNFFIRFFSLGEGVKVCAKSGCVFTPSFGGKHRTFEHYVQLLENDNIVV